MFSLGKMNLRIRTQSARETAPCLAPPASVYLLVPSLQGEWNPQPLPEITSTLKEPAPNCPAQQAPSHTNPTVVSVSWGRG